MKIRNLLIGITAVLAAVLLVLWLSSSLRASVASLIRDTNAPYGRFVVQTGALFSGTANALRNSVAIREQNAALRTEIEQMRVRLLFLDQAERENAALRQALKLKNENPSYLCADIVSRGGASGWWNTVRINKGADEGVQRGSPVVSTDGLVGRVLEVTSDTADILFLADANSKVSCYIEGAEAGARGIVSGAGISVSHGKLDLLHVVEPMSLAYLDKAIEIKKGARVITSGLGSVYPPGLPVGEIVDVSPDSSKLFQRATVAPYADFASLNRVFVILGTRHTTEEVNR